MPNETITELEALRQLKRAVDAYWGIPAHRSTPEGGADIFERGGYRFARVWFNNEYPLTLSEDAVLLLWPGIPIENA